REDLAFLVHSLGLPTPGQAGAARVRIGDPTGRVTFSSDLSEIGGKTSLPDAGSVRYFTAGVGRRSFPALALTRSIRNEPECYNAACHAHPATQQVLGVLDVQMTLDRVESTAASFERESALLGALGVLLIAGLALPVIRMQLAAARRESERWT